MPELASENLAVVASDVNFGVGIGAHRPLFNSHFASLCVRDWDVAGVAGRAVVHLPDGFAVTRDHAGRVGMGD
jgi:hypothetical protein